MNKVASLLVLISSAGLAQAAEMPNLFNNNAVGVRVSDEVLSGQRGKFITGPQAHYFGIEFVTAVAGPNGTIMTSGMQLNVNLNHNQPTVSVNGYGDEAPSASQNNLGNNTLPQLPNGSGLVQVAQIAGNANIGINDLAFVSGEMQIKGNPLTQGHYQLTLPEGMVSYDFNNGGLGMSYTTSDGSVSATQMLRSNKGNQGFVQQLSIIDDSKLLSNQAKFYMGDQLGSYQDLAKTLQQQLPTGIR